MHEVSLVTVAACQYPVEFVGSWSTYSEKVEGLVRAAVEQGAQLLLFPEYACLELVSLFPAHIHGDLQNQLIALQSLLPDYRQFHRQLAHQYGIYLVSASFPVCLEDGTYRNRAYFCTPDGSLDYQDKLMMTRWERNEWNITSGTEIKVFATQFGMMGISICYDSEFPLIARRQAEMGAQLLLVPSCTDTLHGYHRVRIGCQARALENQCYVVMAPLIGTADWSEAIDINVGAAGFFTPADSGFPVDGMQAMGALNEPQWLIQDVDLSKSTHIRSHGQVANYTDWANQHQLASVPITQEWLIPALTTSMLQENTGNVPAVSAIMN